MERKLALVIQAKNCQLPPDLGKRASIWDDKCQTLFQMFWPGERNLQKGKQAVLGVSRTWCEMGPGSAPDMLVQSYVVTKLLLDSSEF